MLSLLEVEAVVEALPAKEQRELLEHLITRLHTNISAPTLPEPPVVRQHILDVPTVSLGGLKVPFSFSRDELYDEMLEDRL